ncbi:MAG: dihydrofolate reductase [Flavobacteriales bacterium]
MNRTQEVIKSQNEQVLYEDEISSKKKSQMFEKKTITLIAAAAQNDALGKDNDLIWHISEDLKRFKRLTTGHAIIMGRKTFESMPKALPNRTNIVLTKNENYKAEGAVVASTIEEALVLAGEDNQPFIIGGAQIYSLFMDHCNRIELTRVHHDFEADVFFPKIDTSKWTISKEEFISKTEDQPYNFTYITYDKK